MKKETSLQIPRTQRHYKQIHANKSENFRWSQQIPKNHNYHTSSELYVRYPHCRILPSIKGRTNSITTKPSAEQEKRVPNPLYENTNTLIPKPYEERVQKKYYIQ